MGIVIIPLAIGILVALITIINLEKKLEEEQEQSQRRGYHLSRILQQVTQLLDNNPNFEYRWNQLGSGDVCYRSSDAVVVFNEFSDKFEGFYVNNKEVTFGELLDIITVA